MSKEARVFESKILIGFIKRFCLLENIRFIEFQRFQRLKCLQRLFAKERGFAQELGQSKMDNHPPVDLLHRESIALSY